MADKLTAETLNKNPLGRNPAYGPKMKGAFPQCRFCGGDGCLACAGERRRHWREQYGVDLKKA